MMGKAPIGVVKLVKKYEKLVLGFTGCITGDAAACNQVVIDVFPILRRVSALKEAMVRKITKKIWKLQWNIRLSR